MAKHEKRRPAMLEKLMPVYSSNESRYPDQIRVSFADGRTRIYDMRMEQPSPIIIRNIEIIRGWRVGYPAQKKDR